MRATKTIALFGGSFNPPHFGHLYVARVVLTLTQVQQVVFVPALCNPHKSRADMLPFKERVRLCNDLVANEKKISVCDIEGRMSLPFSVRLLRKMLSAEPYTRFVWVMGGDNISHFHKWRLAKNILHMVPLVVVARAAEKKIIDCPLYCLVRGRVFTKKPEMICHRRLPAVQYLDVPLHPASSTQIRNADSSCVSSVVANLEPVYIRQAGSFSS